MVTTQVDPAAVYQVVYDLSGLATVKPEPGQENMISIELGEFHATTLSFSVVCIHDNGPRKGEEQLGRWCQSSVIRTHRCGFEECFFFFLLEQMLESRGSEPSYRICDLC